MFVDFYRQLARQHVECRCNFEGTVHTPMLQLKMLNQETPKNALSLKNTNPCKNKVTIWELKELKEMSELILLETKEVKSGI